MTIEERMDRLEAKLGSQDELVRELREALTVNARLESRHRRMVEDHQNWLEAETLAIARHRDWLTAHEAAIARHELWREQHDREMRELREQFADMVRESRDRGRVVDQRIEKLVSGLGEFMRREAPPQDHGTQ